MKTKNYISIAVAILLTISQDSFAGGGHDHGHGHDEHVDKVRKGQHGGKVFEEGGFAIEVTIFEDGVPPQYRLYPYLEGEPLNPAEVVANIELTRFGDLKENFSFSASKEFLVSPKVVEEPHSFEVVLSAKYKEKPYTWKYESFEGRTELSSDALKIANLSIEKVGPQVILSSAKVYGRLIPNEDKVAHVNARFPGLVKQITKSLGDSVSKGDLLAIVESNQSLQAYEIRSQVAGQVIKRHATLGEFVSDSRELFVIADLSEVWADFQVYRDDFGPIVKGQEVKIDLGNNEDPIVATLSYVSPVTDVATQSKTIRAVLPNLDGALRPGLFVSGILASSKTEVGLAVRREAIQKFRDWDVVYLNSGSIFQAIPVELGIKDSQYIEVLSGLKLGDSYVSKNSFIVKADIEKSGASHDH